ncbi:MAG: hypothetical protein IJV67_06115 [Clostridia bacterium]|nr:hypothetical protein [Clostridia bacterium]MBQ9710178.1 hypothetical protein [Clostridia bacterium]
MDIICAVRELCKGENGFEDMFNKAKSGGKLGRLTGGSADARLYETLIYGSARGKLLELISDAYNHKEYAPEIKKLLVSDGLSKAEAEKALKIFYTAFGFPGYRKTDASKEQTIIDDRGSYRTEYRGDAEDGKEHGVGVRNFYYHGKWSSMDECVWIDGVMCGYDSAKELEFGAFEDRKFGFVVNDCFVGRFKCLFSDGSESYESGGKLKIK